MKYSIPSLLLVLAGFVSLHFVAGNDGSSLDPIEVSGVEAAVLDYVEGIYNVQPERIEKSVSKDLVKYGYWRSSAEKPYAGSLMTYDQLYSLAGSWNKGGRQNITDATPKDIKVLDVLDKTATAKLTAHWGIDYFQLEKVEDRWMIRHVLWQSHP